MYSSHHDLPTLSASDAAELLRVHSMTLEDSADERLDSSLLLSFRSWNGEPNWQGFHEVMACIKTLGPAWSATDQIDRGPMRDLWGILSAGQLYVNDPQKKQNILANPGLQPEMTVEEWWLACIGYAVEIYLQFDDDVEAFTLYNELLRQADIG